MMPPCPPSSSEQQAGSSRSRKPLGPTSSSATGQSRGSMNDIFHKQHSSSDEEDEADLSNANAQANKKGNMKQGHNRSKDSSRLNGSAKNLSVRFDPSQVQTSPHMEHQQLQQQQQPQPQHGRKGHGHHGGHHGHHKKGHHHHHRSRRAQSRQPERANYYHHQAAMIPRSHSYSGQVGLQESLAHMGHPVPNQHQIPMLNRHQSPHVGRRPPVQPPIPPPSMMPNNNYYSNYHSHQVVSSAGFVEELDDDVCSTCSSSSSDSDDPYAYQLPPRKAYGGVRLSYVPNDRIRARNHQRSIQGPHSSEYVSQRHSMRGGSVQPQSLPPAAPRQQQQHQQQQQPQHQQLPPRHPDYHPMHHHHAQQPQPQQQQQQQQYAHPGQLLDHLWVPKIKT